MNQSNYRNARLEPWLASGLIILATALTYGILIPRLGFYHDDWYMLWSGQSKDGLSAIIRLFQTDRPLIGWTYALIFKFIGANVLMWQVLALLLKISTGLSVLWLLRMVWPEKRLETTFTALLFVLYPGFFQQPVAATFCIDLLGLNAIFVSIALTIYSLKTSNRLLQAGAILLAMVLGLINLGLYEATIGLEVVRWALVWVVLRQNKPNSPDAVSAIEKLKAGLHIFTGQVLKFLVPYLIMLAGFMYWRLFIFKSVRRATNIDVLLSDYASNPLLSIAQIVIGYIKDLFETVISAWFVPFYQFTAEGRFNNFLSALGIALVVLALIGAYLFLARRESGPSLTLKQTGFENDVFLWIGLIGVVVPSAVIVLLGRNVIFSTQWDRYTTQSMLGVAILVSGLIFKFLRAPARGTVLVTLIMLAVMTQYHSAAAYSRFWDYERGVIWQLSWRAPGLQPGTTLIVSLPEGSRLAEEYEIWGPVNMAYYPGQPMQVSGQVPTDGLILDLQARTLDKRTVRNINVRRDYGNPLIVSLPSGNSCVHILDGQHLALPFFESGVIKAVAGYSNIGLIDPSAQPVKPAAAIFGAEPEHDWCYSYQKIELALQSGQFAQAAKLADEAAKEGLKPADETEWIPVIVAYSGTQQNEKAAAAAQEIDKDLRKYICLQQAQSAVPGPGTQPTYDSALIRNPLCGGK
jgi:hypothetical protein